MCHHEHGSYRAATAVIQNIIFISNYWVGNKFILELDETEFDYLFAEEWHHPTSAHLQLKLSDFGSADKRS